MKYSGSMAILLAAPLAGFAQTTVFDDNFSNGSTINGASTPGGTATASSTSYDIASSKAATTGSSIASGNLQIGLNGTTTSGFVEAQAVFTGSPITLATVGDYVSMTYTFTDTSGLGGGGNSSGIFTGLYNSGGLSPVAGGLNNSGLSTNSTSAFASGNAAGWQGYASRIYAYTAAGNGTNGTAAIYTRPAQNGVGTSSANQELIGNAFGSGTYNNPAGANLASSSATAVTLNQGSQYTVVYSITLSAAGALTIGDYLYSGANTNGTALLTQTGTATGANDLTQTIDSLAIGVRNSGTTLDPKMGVNDIIITDDIQSVPEPTALALISVGSLSVAWFRQRRSQS